MTAEKVEKKWIKAAKGVRYWEHPSKKHKGKPDRYWMIYFRRDGKIAQEGVGWSSEGANLGKAQAKLLEFTTNAKDGAGPISSKEKRATKEKQRAAEIARQELEEQNIEQEARENAPFGQLVDSYIEWAKTNKKSVRMDESRCRIHIKPFLGAYPAKQISISILNDFRDELIKKGLSPATSKHCFVLIRQIFNHHISMAAFSGKNPVSKQNLPRSLKEKMIPGSLDNQRLRFLSPAEADELLAELKGRSQTTHDIALLSLRTGGRFQEIASLTWQSVDLFNDEIHILGKNGKTRQAFITPDIKALFLARAAGKPDSLVFESLAGGQIQQISWAFWRAVKALKFNENVSDPKQKVVFHTLRHTFASWLAQQGTSLFVIQELMGHKRIEMTMRYSHLLPDTKREAIMQMFTRYTSSKVIRLSDRK